MEANDRFNKIYEKGYRLTDFVIYLYLAALFGIYLNIFDNKYFNITYTRYKCFMVISIIFVCLYLAVFLAEHICVKKGKLKGLKLKKEERDFHMPDFWAELFFMGNFFAWLIAADKKISFTGEHGRYIGFFAVMVFFAVFLAFGRGVKMHMIVYYVLGLSTIWAHIVGISQHHGYDFLGLRERITDKYKYVFISNFGNINVYASFICISLPVFLCIFIFEKKKTARIFSAIIIFMSGMSLMVCASDSVYLGVFAAVFLIWFLAFNDDKVTSYFAGLFILMAGNLATVVMNRMSFSSHKKREGLSKTFDSYKFAVLILLVIMLLFAASFFLYKKYGEAIGKMNKKKIMLIMLAAFMLLGIALFAVGVSLRLSLFVFNDKWGDYRGFIWRISKDIYMDFPITNKIFGNGNETVRALTTSTHYDEMISVTGKVYDNCHNEILHFLLTTGLVGAVGYVGLFVSSLIYTLKNAKKNIFCYISAAVLVGYFSQAMVCVSQPITTPLYYVFIAISVGGARYSKLMENKSEDRKNAVKKRLQEKRAKMEEPK